MIQKKKTEMTTENQKMNGMVYLMVRKRTKRRMSTLRQRSPTATRSTVWDRSPTALLKISSHLNTHPLTVFFVSGS
jgi:hypothetical protein